MEADRALPNNREPVDDDNMLHRSVEEEDERNRLSVDLSPPPTSLVAWSLVARSEIGSDDEMKAAHHLGPFARVVLLWTRAADAIGGKRRRLDAKNLHWHMSAAEARWLG